MRRYLFLLSVVLLAGFLVVIGILVRPTAQWRGSLITPPMPAPEIVLPQADGQVFRLSDQKGRVVLLFFGYTYCPDVCPSTLGTLNLALKRLGSRAEQVQVVFISVDPQRDTPQKAQDYASAFNTKFLGLSGSEETLQPIWQAYGVYRAVRPAEGNVDEYLVDHSARVYLVDKQGNLRLTYAFGTPVDDLVSDLRLILREH